MIRQGGERCGKGGVDLIAVGSGEGRGQPVVEVGQGPGRVSVQQAGGHEDGQRKASAQAGEVFHALCEVRQGSSGQGGEGFADVGLGQGAQGMLAQSREAGQAFSGREEHDAARRGGEQGFDLLGVGDVVQEYQDPAAAGTSSPQDDQRAERCRLLDLAIADLERGEQELGGGPRADRVLRRAVGVHGHLEPAVGTSVAEQVRGPEREARLADAGEAVEGHESRGRAGAQVAVDLGQQLGQFPFAPFQMGRVWVERVESLGGLASGWPGCRRRWRLAVHDPYIGAAEFGARGHVVPLHPGFDVEEGGAGLLGPACLGECGDQPFDDLLIGAAAEGEFGQLADDVVGRTAELPVDIDPGQDRGASQASEPDTLAGGPLALHAAQRLAHPQVLGFP